MPGPSKSFFTPLQPALRLIPSFLHDAERQDLDIELARFRQQAQDDLAAQLESHSRGGSVSRSRSGTPATKEERPSVINSQSGQTSNGPDAKRAKNQDQPLQADLGYKSGRPRLPSALKFVTNATPADTGVLMSARSDDDDTSEEDMVVVTSRRVGVHFA